MGEPNKTVKIGLVVVGGLALMVGTVLGAVWVSGVDNRRAAAGFPECKGVQAVHSVVIRGDKVVPAHTLGKRCDRLVITNLDDKPRILAFGVRDQHEAYDGVSERYLGKDSKFSVTLVQPGNFRFHDHVEESVQGTFTVTE